MTSPLLVEGRHRDLNISVGPLTGTGAFSNGGWKLIWHTTEGANFHAMATVLRSKGAEPHVLIDPVSGLVLQMIRFDQYARALQHPAGTPETNRARCIQVEICGFARDSHGWPERYYQRLAQLALMIEHRVPIRRTVPRRFRGQPGPFLRYTPAGFVGARGHVGHQHVPHNDHWDPGALRARHIVSLM